MKVCLAFTDRQPESVREMYQEAVCALWEAWPRFRGESKESTWVYRIALNTAVTQLRHRSRQPRLVELTDEMERTLREEKTDALVDRLYTLIDRLAPPDRALILLYLDKLPEREIATVTGISEGNVRLRIHRIKQKLIALNNEYGTEQL